MAQPGQLKFGRTDKGYTLRAEGRCTSAHSRAAEAFVNEVLQQPACEVVVDLSAAEYVDSTFIGCLLGMHRRHPTDRFRVVAPKASLSKLFGATRIDQVLRVTDETPSVIGSYTTLSPQAINGREMATHIMECHRRLAAIPGPQQTVFASIAQKMEKELDAGK